MQILAIDLENVKSYEQATVEFTQGVNAIVGHNGAGKSTILEAIGFAVFDSLDYKHSDFVRNGAKTATAIVTILSSLDERAYQVVRRIGSSNQHYILDPEIGVRICEGKVDVLSFLRQHLGVESTADLTALFRDAVGVAQGTLTAAFLATPGQRKPIFDSLLQVEEFQKAYERLREPLRLLSQRRQELEVRAAGMQARLERLPELEAEMERSRREEESARKHLEQQSRDLELIVGERVATEAIRDRLMALRNKELQATQRLQSAENQLVTARQAKADAEDAREIVARNQRGHETYVATQTRQRELDARVRLRQQVENRRAAADKALALLESELARLEQELASIGAAEAMVKSLQTLVEQQDRLEEKMAEATRQQALLLEYVERAKRQEESVLQQEARYNTLKTAQARADQLDRERAVLQKEIKELRSTLDRYRDDEARFKVVGTTLKERTEILEDAETAFCPVCEQPLLPSHRTELLMRNQEQLAQLRADFRKTQEQISETARGLQGKEEALTRLEQELRTMPRVEELADVHQQVENNRLDLESTRTKIDKLRGTSEQSRALGEQLHELGDPRSRYSVATERASHRSSVEMTIQEVTQKGLSRRRELADVLEQMEQFADLEDQADAAAAALQEHADAYQAVIANRRLANMVGDRTVEFEQCQQAHSEAEHVLSAVKEEWAEAEVSFDADAHQQLVAREQELRSVTGGINAKLAMLADARQRDEADLKALVKLKDESHALASQQRALADQEGTLDSIRSLLRQAGPYITSVMIRQISEGARGIYSDIMQDYSRHLTWNDDYGITVEVDGHDRQFSQLSGGEQMSAALALRLSLLREMSNIDVAFFDEPTANLDENRRESLARQILQVKGFRQLFVISHDDTFEQATQNLIRVERINGISRVQDNT